MKMTIKILLFIGLAMFVGGIVAAIGCAAFGWFQTASEVRAGGALANPTHVSAGIATGLVGFATGLVVAVPGFLLTGLALILHFATKSRPQINTSSQAPPLIR